MNRTQRTLSMAVLLVGLAALPAVAADVATAPVAVMSAGSASLDFTTAVEHEALVLTVSGPNDYLFRKEFKAGETPSFSLFNKRGQRLADGHYNYELRVAPVVGKEVRDRLTAAREAGNEKGVLAELRRTGVLPEVTVQSGAFAIANGALMTPGQAEPEPRRARRNKAAGDKAAGIANTFLADQVIPDDLIVEGSGCFGFDCVDGESFGLDTIRLKENSLRIKFEDTSVSPYPTNDWQLTANDSASGGANKFSIEDITGAKVPFTITAGASTNSIFVDSTGRVGFRTATPVLDLHVATSNTPAMRLEQNNSGGFTAQTWDIGANEANFFVRDVTGGSKLSFRIRPGAPTSSIDISADGDVGIGTASPDEKLHIEENVNENTFLVVENTFAGTEAGGFVRAKSDTATLNFQAHSSARTISRFGQVLGGWGELLFAAGNGLILGTNTATPLILGTNSANRIHIQSGGNVGIGTSTPAHPLQMASGAHVTAGGVWTSVSTRDAKHDIEFLEAEEASKALTTLQPVRFKYNAEPGEEYVGFIAEDVPDLVAANDHKSLNPMDVVAVLTKVVQDQQKTIAELAARVAELEKQ
ncbi:MAG TPA: tail fiber domain-containing protein [Thermoanaerobaculia bacterium]|nr:tail fiber domain-containing protein [Thermoanaerobaculia bacterium]